jgi:hypothetical protein
MRQAVLVHMLFRLLEICILNHVIDFLPMNGNILRGFDSETHPVPTHLYDENGNVIVNDDTFIYSTGENQHGYPLFLGNV